LQAEKTVSIPANGNENVFSSEIQKLAKDADLTETVLICSLREKNQIISQDFLYFKPVKELNLPDANVKLAVTESPTGYEITLTSNALAKNVYLTCDAIDGFFTDNYFDLLPGRPVTVTYQISTPRVVKKDLFKVRTVKDTY
jgi:beta-mannosidase